MQEADRRTVEEALEIGIELASEAVEEGVTLIGTGEMGIGNTTASAAITAVMTGASVEQVTGLGTGIDERPHTKNLGHDGRALARHQPNADDPIDVLAKIGGLEIAGMAGLMLGAAAAHTGRVGRVHRRSSRIDRRWSAAPKRPIYDRSSPVRRERASAGA